MLSPNPDKAWSPGLLLGALRLADLTIVGASAVAAFYLRHGHLEIPWSYAVVTGIGILLMANALHGAGFYDFDKIRHFTRQFYRLSVSMAAVFLGLVALGFFTKMSEEFSRVWIALWFCLAFTGLSALRAVMSLRIRAWQSEGRLARNVVIIGAGELGQRLVRHVTQWAEPGVRLLGLFDDRKSRIPSEIEGYAVLGTVDDLAAFTRENRVDDVVIALPWSNEPRLLECMRKVKSVPVTVHLCPDSVGFQLYNRGVNHLAGIPMLSVSEPPLTVGSLLVKAIEDRLLAGLILVLILPLLALIAIAVKLDSPGPVLFRQRRYGFNNNEITIYKFRTMADDPSYADGGAQATRDDPRVTRVGRFLRSSSFDELPQIINVLKGEMSLVGPRPHAVVHNLHYDELIDGYLGRHKVKPGITGWAQVNGLRGETETLDKMEARVQHDLYYVDNWSLLFDLRILFLTLFVGFRSRQAY